MTVAQQIPTPRWRRTKPDTSKLPQRAKVYLGTVQQRRALADRIRESRREAGLTQVELSELAGLGETTVSQMETGRHWPNVLTLTKVCVALEISPTDIIGL